MVLLSFIWCSESSMVHLVAIFDLRFHVSFIIKESVKSVHCKAYNVQNSKNFLPSPKTFRSDLMTDFLTNYIWIQNNENSLFICFLCMVSQHGIMFFLHKANCESWIIPFYAIPYKLAFRLLISLYIDCECIIWYNLNFRSVPTC